MAEKIQLKAEVRTGRGKGVARRLRRLEAKVPAIVYGGGKDPVAIAITQHQVARAAAQESFYSQILTLEIGNDSEQAIVRDMQRHPATDVVTHVDFQRVRQDQVLHVNIPLHFINEERCVGVRLGGGTLTHNLNDVEIACLPKDLPQYIEVDVVDMQVGQSIHLSDLKLPEGVSIPSLVHGSDYDLQVVACVPPRTAEAEATPGAGPAATPAAST